MAINLGNIVQQNGRNTGNGIISGLDSQALIDGILAAREASVTDIEDKIETNSSRIDEVSELRRLIDSVRLTSNLLRNPPGIGNASDNLFKFVTSSVISNTTVEGSTYLDVNAAPGASPASYDINNITLAKAHTLIASGFASKSTSVVGSTNPLTDYSATIGTVVGDALDASEPVTFAKEVDVAGTQASIDLVFSADNEFDAADSLVIGTTSLTFGALGGDDLDISGAATLEDKLVVIANHLNAKTTGEEAGYTYTISGGNTLTLTRNDAGDNATVDTNLQITSDFSSGATAQTVVIGDVAATNASSTGGVNSNGTDGTNNSLVSDANSTSTSTLSGAITGLSATLNAGSAIGTTSFNENTVTFTVTVGGETYTSRPVALLDGSIDGNGDTSGDNGAGLNGFGNRIPSGTKIEFVKDVTSDPTAGTEDIAFELNLAKEFTIDTQSGANAADDVATEIQSFLTDSSVAIVNATPPLREGTFDLGGVSISISEGETLSSIRSKINATTSSSGVSAEIIQVSDSAFSLVLQSSETGLENKIGEYGDGDVGDPLAGYLKFGGTNIAFTQTQAGSDASFDLNGQTITRASNAIGDVLDNVTFTLKSDTPDSGTVVKGIIQRDTGVIKTGIKDFITAYNNLKFYVAEQQDLDSNGNPVEGAFLGEDSILLDSLQAITDRLFAKVEGLDDDVSNTIFGTGVDTTKFPGDGTTPPADDVFFLDDAVFDKLAAEDFSQIENIFAFQFVASSPELSVFSRTNAATLNNFQLDIDITRGESDSVRVLDSDGVFLFNAKYDQKAQSIIGVDGTSLEGLKLIYTGNDSETITVSFTQGIADSIYNATENILKDTGSLDQFVISLTADNERFSDDVTAEQARISDERNRLIRRFTELESIISGFNTTLDFFAAQRAQLNQSS